MVSGVHSKHGLLVALVGVAFAGCSGGSGGDVMKSEDEVTLLDVQQQVFTPRCALSGCHVGAESPFGLDLSAGLAADNIIGVPSGEVPELLRVEPYDADDSYLYMKLVDAPDIEGDPMPLEGDPLTAGQLALIEDWIDQGAN